MEIKLSKELKRKKFMSEVKFFVFMMVAVLPVYFGLNFTVSHENVFIRSIPIFAYFLLIFVYAAMRPFIDRKLIEEIHSYYEQQLKTMPCAQLSTIVLQKSTLPYLVPKLLANIVCENSSWDDQRIMTSNPDLVRKVPTLRVADLKANQHKLTKDEWKSVEAGMYQMLAEYIVRTPPEYSLADRMA